MSRKVLAFAAILLIAPTAVFAQGGCVNSPECPTLVLGLVGAASAVFTAGRVRMNRAKANRKVS